MTPRQNEVLKLASRGLSTGEIATKLGMTVDDVRCDMKSVMLELDAASKLEAIIRGIRRGLV